MPSGITMRARENMMDIEDIGSFVRIEGEEYWHQVGILREIYGEKCSVSFEDEHELFEVESKDITVLETVDPDSELISLLFSNQKNVYDWMEETGCWLKAPQYPELSIETSDIKVLLQNFLALGETDTEESGWNENMAALDPYINTLDTDFSLITPESVVAWALYELVSESDGSGEFMREVLKGLRNLEDVLEGEEAEVPDSYWALRFYDVNANPSSALEWNRNELASLIAWAERNKDEDALIELFLGELYSDEWSYLYDVDRAEEYLRAAVEADEDPDSSEYAALRLAELLRKDGNDGEASFYYSIASSLRNRMAVIRQAEIFIEKGLTEPAVGLLKKFEEDYLHTLFFGTGCPELLYAEMLLSETVSDAEERREKTALADLLHERQLDEGRAGIDDRTGKILAMHQNGLCERDYVSLVSEGVVRDEAILEEVDEKWDEHISYMKDTDELFEDETSEEDKDLWSAVEINWKAKGDIVFTAEVEKERIITIKRGNMQPFLFDNGSEMLHVEDVRVLLPETYSLKDGEYRISSPQASLFTQNGRKELGEIYGWSVFDSTLAEFEED